MNASIISARILHHIGNGMTLASAIDAVLGAGTYSAIATEVYAALRKEG